MGTEGLVGQTACLQAAVPSGTARRGNRSYFHQSCLGWCHPGRVQREYQLLRSAQSHFFFLKIFKNIFQVGWRSEMKRAKTHQECGTRQSFLCTVFRSSACARVWQEGTNARAFSSGKPMAAEEEEVVSSQCHREKLKACHS